MATITEFPFDTGLASLPDIGTLSYNGVTFSSLYHTKISGKPQKDNANRTIKYVEYLLEAVGVVTLPFSAQTIDDVFDNMRSLLELQGGMLVYTGRGFGNNFVVNPTQGLGFRDVAWGPIPEVLEFEPLGQGRSAHCVFRVTFHISEYGIRRELKGGVGGPPGQRVLTGGRSLPKNLVQLPGGGGSAGTGPVLQFNFETSIVYDADGYTQLQLRGTLEIPITRNQQLDRTIPDSVDSYRQRFMEQIIGAIDQTRFKITRRSFPISRDQRTMDWEIVADELPPMGLPPGATTAHGRFTLHSHSGKGGLAKWTCSLSVTYTIRKDKPRRLAYFAFAYLLWWRMRYSQLGFNSPANKNNPQVEIPDPEPVPQADFNPGLFYADPVNFYRNLFQKKRQEIWESKKHKAILTAFGLDEGMHDDSKTITFEASWFLACNFASVMQACGVWRFDPDSGGENVWRLSIEDVTNWRSWLVNDFSPNSDVIVDMGSS